LEKPFLTCLNTFFVTDWEFIPRKIGKMIIAAQSRVAEVKVDGAQPSLVAAGGHPARAPGCQQRFRPPHNQQ